MTRVSTARETIARFDARIASESNPKHKRWLKTNRDHYWGEVIGDLDLIMSTMSRGPIRYSYDGHPFMASAGGLSDITSYEATRQMYAGVQALGARAAGPMDDERFLFDERGMFVYGILTVVYPGTFLPNYSGIDPAALYLVRFTNVTMLQFDEHGLMTGEGIINGAPLLVQPADRSYIDRLIDGPLPAL